MRLLVLGMCRTGTSSLAIALRKLGYTPHQMRDLLSSPSDLALWQEAINLTLLATPSGPSPRKQPPFKKPEFDKLLADYDVAMDLPSCIFAKELLEVYPEAKVILTKRAYGDWEKSMRESIWCLDTWRLFALCRWFNLTQLAPLIRLVHSLFLVHNGNTYSGPKAQAAFEKHYDTVRSLVPANRLLELDTDGEIGWETLCGFLGEEVPPGEGKFPRVDEEKGMRRGLEQAWWGMVWYFALLVVLPGGVVVVGLVAWVWAEELWGWRDAVLGVGRRYLETGEW
ncbi:hypothetical protein GMOD_00009286 [Pyrenophora seminiperda CCB06]|uniref:Nad dependent epimerase dehydratase n=1 Tax=Pyrenophora seminiperda CCB06 TaxID=1302712 RepID=A0A3M7MBS8_9PLEO|nr:hypothetical protein GMOD_00009286 [Pyrenophora seminiperda CCB06]